MDLKGRDYAKYRGATVIKPNVQEVLQQEINDDDDLSKAGNQLLRMLKGTTLLISRGQKGMTLFRAKKPPLSISATTRAVFDVTGAGDTVICTLALSLTSGASLKQAAHLVNRATGIVVRKVGTGVVTVDELSDRLKSRHAA